MLWANEEPYFLQQLHVYSVYIYIDIDIHVSVCILHLNKFKIWVCLKTKDSRYPIVAPKSEAKRSPEKITCWEFLLDSSRRVFNGCH